MKFSTQWPPSMTFGPGTLQTIGEHARRFNARHALILTDPGLEACGIAGRVAAALDKAGIGSAVYAGVRPNPTMTEVTEAIRRWQADGHDLLVALGGGSSIDAAKVVAAQLLTGRNIEDLVRLGVDDVAGDPVPFLCVTTTSGTGSEATSAAMIKDDAGRKHLVRSFRCRPAHAILDPELTLSVPPRMTAATGMDALIHSIGAFTNRGQHPIADVLALEAIRLVVAHLESVVRDGSNLTGRTAMMLASHLSGFAISCKGNDAIHGLSTPVESLLDVTHGESLSAILPQILEANLPAAPDKFAAIGRAIGVTGATEAETASRAVAALIALRDRVGTATALGPLGVEPAMIDRLTELALASRSTQLNVRTLDGDEIRRIYAALL